jgi:hypothetical protein
MEMQSSHAVQDPEVREMVDDLMEFSRRRGAERDGGRKDSKDKDRLADEEFESVAVWIKEKNSPSKSDSESKEQNEAETLFNQYVHHHYVRRWGLLAEKKGKDEEWWIPNPPVLNESDSNYLCDTCRHIDLEHCSANGDCRAMNFLVQPRSRSTVWIECCKRSTAHSVD